MDATASSRTRIGHSRGSFVERRLVAYLELLAGRAETGALLEIRWRRPRGMGQAWFRVDDLERAGRVIAARSHTTDVYVGCAPRTRRSGGRDAVVGGWVLWADLDEPDVGDRLSAVPVPPTAIVHSGSGGAHLYWALRDPVTVATLEPANRRLAEMLGADPSSADAARILRPPFTLNFKSIPSPVALEELLPDRRYAVEHVVGTLPCPPLDAPGVDQNHWPSLHHDDPLHTIPPRVYVEALLGVAVPRHGKVRCLFHPDRTPSLHVYPTPEQGWFCFGCRRGGTVYDLAAEIWEMDTRGSDFVRLRRRLCRTLRGRPTCAGA